LSGNRDLFLNAVSWLAEEEDLIAIRAKDPESSPLLLSAVQVRAVFVFSVIVMPFAVIVTGVVVLFERRKSTR